MCDAECLKHLIKIETEIGVIRTDVKWLKWLVRGSIIILGAILGVDLSGVV